jgi:hypothetical protein
MQVICKIQRIFVVILIENWYSDGMKDKYEAKERQDKKANY